MGNEREPTSVTESSTSTESPDSDSPGSRLADDKFYRALAARPRRRLLAYLLEHETATRDDLAAVLVGWETTDSGETAGTDSYRRIRTMLRHSHLPMLDDAGLVTYDSAAEEVTLRDLDERAVEVLQLSIATEQG